MCGGTPSLSIAATAQHPFQGLHLSPVHRQLVLALHLDHLACNPASVPLRHLVRRVLGFLDVAVQPRGRQGQVQKVCGKGAPRLPVRAAQAAVVRFASGDNVLDVGFLKAVEHSAGVLRPDTSQPCRDLRLNRWRVSVVAGARSKMSRLGSVSIGQNWISCSISGAFEKGSLAITGTDMRGVARSRRRAANHHAVLR